MSSKMKRYIEFPSTMSINGYCGAGKSYCIREIISSTSDKWSYIMVISNTASFNNDYRFIKSLKIPHKVFGTSDFESNLTKLMDIQKNNKTNNVLVVFDDIMGSIKDNKLLKNLVSTYRHYRISIIFSSQYVNSASTYLREICQYVIIFNQRSKRALQATYDAYFQDIPTFAKFKRMFSDLPKYHFYFIDRKFDKRNIMIIK